jgi:hypothetical protein
MTQPKVDNKWVGIHKLFNLWWDDNRHCSVKNCKGCRIDREIEWEGIKRILLKPLITQTQQEILEKAVKVIKKHRPVFFKGDIKSLLSQDEVMRVREVLRIEILEELGVDCTKMRQIIKKKMEGRK